MMPRKKKRRRKDNTVRNLVAFGLTAIVVCGLLFSPLGLQLLHMVGFRYGMQGLDMTWNSVWYKDYWYDRSQWGPNPNYDDRIASAHTFIDILDLDPDEENILRPNLLCESGPVTVRREVAPIIYGPWRIKVGEEWVERKNATHKWKEKQDIYKEAEIQRFECKWEFNLWLDGADREAYPHIYKKWQQADIWIRIVPQSFCYFVENPDQVFFAPAFIQVSDVTTYYGGEEDPRVLTDWDIIPEQSGAVFYIFYERGGTEPDPPIDEEILSYQDMLLDPAIFRDEYWIRIHIIELAAKSAMNPVPPGTWWYDYPSYNFDVLVYVFVVGEWTVKLFTDEIKELEPHKTGFVDSFWTLLGQWFNSILTNPWAWLIIIIILGVLGVVAIILLAVFAPGILRAAGSAAETATEAVKKVRKKKSKKEWWD